MPICECGKPLSDHRFDGEKLIHPKDFPDLQTQLESLLNQVWVSEDAAMVEDRFDNIVKYAR